MSKFIKQYTDLSILLYLKKIVFNTYWYFCIKSNYKSLIKVSILNAQFYILL